LFSGIANKESRPDRFPDGRLPRSDQWSHHGGEPVSLTIPCSFQGKDIRWSFNEYTTAIAAAGYRRCVPRSPVFVMTAPLIACG
jgi:hypothetical protein